MGLKARGAPPDIELSRVFEEQIIPGFRAGSHGPRRPSGTRLQALEDNIHGLLPERLRLFLELDDELELNDGIGPWDLLKPTDRMAPMIESGNLFEQIVLDDQEQFACNVGLLQIAASAIPVGIMEASDLYFVSLGEKTKTHPVCWFVPQDDGEVVGVIADSLESFGYMSLLAKRVADGDEPSAIRADAEAIRGRCTPRWLSSELFDVLGNDWPDTEATSQMDRLYDRSLPWLYALSPYLRTVGQDDKGCRYTLAERWAVASHLADGWQDVYGRARPEDHLHDAFYWLWRSYFLDEVELESVQDRCMASPRPVIVDMARLVEELRRGRCNLGIVDVAQVRNWLREIAGVGDKG